MLRDSHAFSGFSSDDLAKSKQFYGQTLGLVVTDGEEKGVMNIHLGGGARAIVYEKPDHEPATFTVLNFPVKDIDEAVQKLSDAGVRFEKYEGFPQDVRGVMRGQGRAIAWFKDPAGNVLSLIEAQ